MNVDLKSPKGKNYLIKNHSIFKISYCCDSSSYFIGQPNLGYLTRIKELIEFVVEMNAAGHRIHLAIGSLIPRPRSGASIDYMFQYTDKLIKRYTQESSGHCSFLDLSGLLRFQDGTIQTERFYDGVHINLETSRLLAEWIRKFIARIPRYKY